jgi:hypothetical protein
VDARSDADATGSPAGDPHRDTLYSGAVVDITDEATLALPDAAGRYISAMVVNEDDYVVRLYRTRNEILEGTWTLPSIVPA